jgi:hypothetical protein
MLVTWGYLRIIILGIGGNKYSVSGSGHFIPKERAHGTHCIQGWETFTEILVMQGRV